MHVRNPRDQHLLVLAQLNLRARGILLPALDHRCLSLAEAFAQLQSFCQSFLLVVLSIWMSQDESGILSQFDEEHSIDDAAVGEDVVPVPIEPAENVFRFVLGRDLRERQGHLAGELAEILTNTVRRSWPEKSLENREPGESIASSDKAAERDLVEQGAAT